ncbi:MAG: ABC transporter substrate-binding protein [Candidatus Binatia bacterium]
MRLWQLGLAFLLLQTVSAFCGTGWAYEIVIFTSADIPAYHKAMQDFKAGLPSATRLTEYNLGGNIPQGREQAKQIRASGPDLVLAVGLKAALIAKVEIVDPPVIFCMVLNPGQYGLPARNMTGILMEVPSARQLASMRTVVPKLSRIGLLYDKAHTEAFVKDAQTQAKAIGLTLVTRPVASHEEVPQALRELLPRVDVLWLLRDPTVVNPESLQFIMRTALDHNTPVFGFSSGLMRHGALATLSLDYQRIGRQAARLAVNILGKRSTTGSLAQLVYPENPQLAINLNAADFFGLTPPKQALLLAAELFGGPGAFAQVDPLESTTAPGDPFLLK